MKLVYIIDTVSSEGMWNIFLEDDGPYDTHISVTLWKQKSENGQRTLLVLLQREVGEKVCPVGHGFLPIVCPIGHGFLKDETLVEHLFL